MTRNANVCRVFFMQTTNSAITIVYTVRAHDDLPSVRFDIEVAIVGGAPRVTVLKDGEVWCDDVAVTDACASISYLSIQQTRKVTLRTKIERAAFSAAVAA